MVDGNVRELVVCVVTCGECSTQLNGVRECWTSVITGNSNVCCRECSTQVVGDGECSTSVVGVIWLGSCCQGYSTLLVVDSNFTDRSTRLYSVLVLIFCIAWWLLPIIFEAAWLISLTFFCFRSIIVSARRQNSGCVHWKFLVFSFGWSLWKDGWALQVSFHFRNLLKIYRVGICKFDYVPLVEYQYSSTYAHRQNSSFHWWSHSHRYI